MIDCPYIQSIQMIIEPGFFSYAKPHGPTGGMDESLNSPKKRGRVSQCLGCRQVEEGRESGGHTYLD